MENKNDHEGTTWKDLQEVKKIKEKVENSYINIIQIVSIVVAVLALVLGNILGFISLPRNINVLKLISFLFIINGIVLIGISFLIFLIKYVFLNSEWKKEYKWFLIFPIAFQIIGLIIYVVI